MADIPSSLSKINDIEVAQNAPHTESLNFKYGADINALIDQAVNKKYQEFFSSGSFVTNPSNTLAIIYCIGGGGGGGGTDGQHRGGGGGGSSYPSIRIVPITGGQTLTVAIGAGGTGGPGNTNGGTGGTSSVTGTGVNVFSRGGIGGQRALDDNPANGGAANSPNQGRGGDAGGESPSGPNFNVSPAQAGQNSDAFNGGAAGVGVSSGSPVAAAGGGGGAASDLGAGANGGNGNVGGANATSRGAGGGGAGGDQVGGFLNGGTGGAGYVSIIAI